jgi:transposase
LAKLEASDLFTAIAWRIKEKLRWIRQAQSVQAARWRTSCATNEQLDPDPLLDRVRKAIATVEAQSKRILQRWRSSHSNARMEGLNGLFQAARARARGYRSVPTFATIIYLIAAPLGDLFESTKVVKEPGNLPWVNSGFAGGTPAGSRWTGQGPVTAKLCILATR